MEGRAQQQKIINILNGNKELTSLLDMVLIDFYQCELEGQALLIRSQDVNIIRF